MTPGRHKALELLSKSLLMLMMGLSAMEKCPPCKSDEIDIREEYPYFKIMYAFPTMYLIQSAVRNYGWVSKEFYTHLLIGYLAVWWGSCVCKPAAHNVDELVQQPPAGTWRAHLFSELTKSCVDENKEPLHMCHRRAVARLEHYALIMGKLDNMFPKDCKCWPLAPGDCAVEECAAENCTPSEATQSRCKREERVCVKKIMEKPPNCNFGSFDPKGILQITCEESVDRFYCTCPDTVDNVR